VAAIEQRSEYADRFAECQQLVDDTVDAAGDHQPIEDIFQRHVVIGKREIVLEDVEASPRAPLGAQVPEIKTVRAVHALRVAAGSRIIGINNRDLGTFETRIETTLALLPRIPPGPVVVSESGFFTGADVRRVAEAGAHAVLVGEALVRAADVAAKLRELTLR